MNIQYISDSNGTPTGVFIPIKDWEEIYFDIKNKSEIPEWHNEKVMQAYQEYKKSNNSYIDSEEVFEKIDNKLK